jgi:hypothetical protein
VAYEISPLSPLSAGAQPRLRAICSLAPNKFDRTAVCWTFGIKFTFRRGRVLIGTLKTVLVQSILLNPRGRAWTEHDTVIAAVPSGTTAPVEVLLTASCDSPCHAVAHFSGVVRVGLTGTVDYTDDIAKNHDHQTPTFYVLDYDAPPYIPEGVVPWTSPISYRCDNSLAVKNSTGCAFPQFTPTLVLSRRQYGASAAMIQWAQQNMSAHWGLRGSGKELTRQADDKVAEENRKKICDSTFTPIAGIGAPNDSDSCDEFPFAKTNQSGAAQLGNRTGAACAQLEAVRTSHAGTEAEQWNSIKVLHANLNAPCVRGHIPLRLNDGAGGAYGVLVQSARLINDDAFWLAVTA